MNTKRWLPGAISLGAVLLVSVLLLVSMLQDVAAQNDAFQNDEVVAVSAQRQLNDIEVLALPGGRVLLTLTLSGIAPSPAVFTVDNPARLSLDLPNTSLALDEKYRPINIGNTRALALAEAGGRTRVVVELLELTTYTVRTENEKLYIQLGPNNQVSNLAPPPPAVDTPVPVADQTPLQLSEPVADAGIPAEPAEQVVVAPLVSVPARTVERLDFRRGENNEARVTVTLSDPGTSIDLSQKSGKIIAELKDTVLPAEYQKRLDVLDFATPAKQIEARTDGRDTRIIVTPLPKADFDHLAYQSGNVYTIELQPLTAAELEARQRTAPKYSGQRISFDFQNGEVRDLLHIIAKVAKVNMVISDSVSGNLALRLDNVPWDQALDILLKTQGLGKRQEGNVMIVGPLAEIKEQELAELDAQTAQEQAAPLSSELIQVNYAKATDIATLLESGEGSILTERGRVSVDERTNTLLVWETRQRLAEIRKLITQLDIQIKQVLIEARIVIASDDYLRSVGSRFGVTQLKDLRDDFTISAGSLESTGSIRETRGDGTIDLGAIPQQLNVNLPVAGAAGQFALALLRDDFLIDLELSALQAEGRGEIISSPKVITANATEATIEQGTEVPFLEAAASGAATISFKKALLKLQVTPQITPDDSIIMDLIVNQDTIGENVAVQGGGFVPSIDTRKVETQVLVRNGETVVLGGIYEQLNSSNTSKVPFLGDLPLIGNFFRTNSSESDKAELLIFVTPKILKEGVVVE